MRTLKIFFVVFALVLIGFARQSFADGVKISQPTWGEIEALYGNKISAPAVTNLVIKYELLKAAKGSSGSLAPKDNAYALVYEQEKIEYVVLNVGPWPDEQIYSTSTTYTNALPFGLYKSDTLADVTAKIGQPIHPAVEPSVHQWVYQGYRLLFIFKENDATIDSIHIWKETPTQARFETKARVTKEAVRRMVTSTRLFDPSRIHGYGEGIFINNSANVNDSGAGDTKILFPFELLGKAGEYIWSEGSIRIESTGIITSSKLMRVRSHQPITVMPNGGIRINLRGQDSPKCKVTSQTK